MARKTKTPKPDIIKKVCKTAANCAQATVLAETSLPPLSFLEGRASDDEFLACKRVTASESA